MNEEKFRIACDRVVFQDPGVNRFGSDATNGIGTLGEKTVHAVLKHYLSPDESVHEQRYNGYIADILQFGECDSIKEEPSVQIMEVQTRNFEKLRGKLDSFLDTAEVTVVYPVAKTKWISWIDLETGDVTKKRKSPKTSGAWELLPELYKIKMYLKHPNLRIHVVLINVVEYRNLNGWSKDKKKGSSRFDGIPVSLEEEVSIRYAADYLQLIPENLGDSFTAKEYSAAAKMSLSRSRTALHVLHHMDAVRRIGKSGKAFLYQRESV